MEGQLEHGDILHGITNNVFQRILDLGPQLREFVTSAKQYHKALLGASVAANSFYQGFTKIAHLASETRGSNKLLGKGICDIIAVHKQIENQANNVIKALNEDFVFPLEEWIEKEINQTKMKQKNYAQENKTAAELVEKSKSNLTKVRKKSQRSKMSDKYEVKEQQILTAHEQYQAKLDELRVLGCHEALKTERNVFSFIVEKMTSVSKIDVGYHEKAYDLLNSRLSTWENLVNQPLSLDVDVSSLVKQLTQNGHYDKSLDEHLSSKNLERTASVGVPTKPNNALSNHRLSHQFSVGFPQIKQDDKSTDMESRGKVQAVFAHDAADSTQLSFKEGDIIKTLTDVTSGWQYGENTRTSKSGWFPVAFTEKVMNVVTSSNPSHTLPLSGHAHPRPPIFPAVNGCQVEPKTEDELHIPARDYGIPLKNVAKKESNNHISANHNDSVSSGIHSPGNSVSSPDSNQHDLDEPYYPPPPPPPPLPVLEEDDSLSTPLPPPPAPPPPPPSVSPRSFDQAL